ncbi:MAG: hypothetical protein HGA97_01075 [Chlorobiaceae bacterium]|nr:hypothetical protein [Chlorobiaceae bacterium]
MTDHGLTLEALTELIETTEQPVILLEGRRAMPVDDYESARLVAELLASRFPNARFRSGNATGSDEAFSKGIVAVDPARLQVIAPYKTHRLKARFSGAAYEYPDALSADQIRKMIDKTISASPKSASLMKLLGQKGSLAAKADYLLRDTMKVIGFSPAFPKATAALFFVDPADPMAGGTGHTIRVCQHAGVPIAFQNRWKQWIQ